MLNDDNENFIRKIEVDEGYIIKRVDDIQGKVFYFDGEVEEIMEDDKTIEIPSETENISDALVMTLYEKDAYSSIDEIYLNKDVISKYIGSIFSLVFVKKVVEKIEKKGVSK
jgi:hypothetical protein